MKLKRIVSELVILASAILLSACARDRIFLHEPGSPIRFGAATGWNNDGGTRTQYSGIDNENGDVSPGSTHERIDWVEGKDRIRILCEAALAGPFADYMLQGVSSDKEKSSAGIVPASGNGLQWGTGDHYFYAMYPAPGSESEYAFTDNPVTEAMAVIESVSGNKAKVSGTIPASQEAVKDGRVYRPNMNYAYMYAATKVEEDATGPVTLSFEPLVTTLEFTLVRLASDDIDKNLTKVELSSASTPLTGDFSATLTETGVEDDGIVAPEYAAADNGKITITLPTESGESVPGVKLTDDPLTITFLTLPVDQTDLTLTLYFGADYATRRTLELKDRDAFITVSACKKAYFRNLTVPGILWEYKLDQLDDIVVTYAGGDGSFAEAFKSYHSGSGSQEAIPFTLEYYWDKQDGNGADWYKEAPDWLSAAPAPGLHDGGSMGEALSATVSPQENSAVDPHHDELSKESRMHVDRYDLSTYDVATGLSVSRSTANCYVVQGAGNYKFPLVYGNGVVDGGVNMDAFRARAGVGGDYRADNGIHIASGNNELNFLGSFKDHLDNNIYNAGDAKSSPYLTTHLDKGADDFKAVLVWQDVQGLVVVDPAISGSGENAYVTFSVPAETITQGNALIAVLVDDDGDDTPETVAWSWHIWVTEEDLSKTGVYCNGYEFAPVNLGWCEGWEIERYEARSCQVRVTQSVSGKTATATVTQTAGSVSTGGNCPYYQWGRKDPIQASNGIRETNKTYYYSDGFSTDAPAAGAKATIVYPGPVSIGTAIQYPHAQIVNSYYPWNDPEYYNNWNSVLNGHGNDQWSTPVTKTIYDPSPVGYKIPPQAAYAGFSDSFPVAVMNGVRGRLYGGLFFPAAGQRWFNSSKLSVVGSSYGYYWTAVPLGHNGYMLYFSGNYDPYVASVGARANCNSVRSVVDE